MNVGDSYDIFSNTNIPNKNWYSFAVSPETIATISAGVITAKASGNAIVTLKANSNYPLAHDKELEVEVVDGIRSEERRVGKEGRLWCVYGGCPGG